MMDKNTPKMRFICPFCHSRLVVAERGFGKTIQCPKCRKDIIAKPPLAPEKQERLIFPVIPVKEACDEVVETVELVEVLPRPVTINTSNLPDLVSEPVPQQQELTSYCPFCREPINVDARKCKHCGEYLDPDLRELDHLRKRGGNHSINIANNAAAYARQQASPVIVQRKGFPHAVFLVLTIITFGAFLPIWIIAFIIYSIFDR